MINKVIALKPSMWIVFVAVVFFVRISHGQVFKVTKDGLLLVADSVSNKKISSLVFTNFKGPLRWDINWDKEWMSKHAGKYLHPNFEYDSLIVVKNDSGWGCITKRGKIYHDFKFDEPIHFFKKGKCYGVYDCSANGLGQHRCDYLVKDMQGNVLARYSKMISQSGELCLLQGIDTDLYGIVSSDLQTILPFEFKCTSWDDKNFGFSNNGFLSLRNKEKKCGVINNKGEIVIPFEYSYVGDVVFDINVAERDGLSGLLDSRMKWVVHPSYEEIKSNYFLKGPVAAFLFKSGKWSLLDSTLRIHDEKFDKYDVYGCVNIIVKANGKFGVYNARSKNYSLQPKYDSIAQYQTTDDYNDCGENIRFLTIIGNKHAIYNAGLQKIFETEAAKVEVAKLSNYIVVEKEQKKYLMKDNGKLVSGPYDEMRYALPASNNSSVFYPYFWVANANKRGWIKADGTVVIPIDYDATCEPRLKYNSDGNHGFTFLLLKQNTIYYFDKNGSSLGTKTCDKCDNFCKQ